MGHIKFHPYSKILLVGRVFINEFIKITNSNIVVIQFPCKPEIRRCYNINKG